MAFTVTSTGFTDGGALPDAQVQCQKPEPVGASGS